MMQGECMRVQQTAVALACLGLTLTTLAACGSSAGDDGGVVQVYAVAGPGTERLEQAFEKAHPDIDAQFMRGANDVLSKADAEIANGLDGADVVLHAVLNWFMANEEHFAPLESDAVGEWPEEAWLLDDTTAHVSYVPQSIIVWNTDVFPEGFERWNDLLDPAVKGKIGTRDTIDDIQSSYLQYLEETNGKDHLPGIAAQQPKFYPSVVPMTQAVASGELGVADSTAPSVLNSLLESGAPIDYVVPEEGGGWAVPYVVAMLEKSERKGPAQTFVDFVLSPEGQEALNGDGNGGSPIQEVPGALDTEGMVLLDPKVTTPDVVARWSDRFDRIFRQS